MSQNIKNNIPKNIINEFFEIFSYNETKYLLVNKYFYKKALISNKAEEILLKLSPYYYKSKQFYLTRKLTYNNFTTILRQICNFHNIPYINKIKYYNSDYIIEYFIYYSL